MICEVPVKVAAPSRGDGRGASDRDATLAQLLRTHPCRAMANRSVDLGTRVRGIRMQDLHQFTFLSSKRLGRTRLSAIAPRRFLPALCVLLSAQCAIGGAISYAQSGSQPVNHSSKVREDASCVRSSTPGSTVDGQSAIIDGKPTGINSHNEVVAVGSDTGFHCSGVLVGPRLVLTARHCLPASRVLFGNTVACAQKTIAVARSETAPGLELDAALLTLAEASAVTPAMLGTDLRELPGNPEIRIVGFGADDPMGRRGFGLRRYADLISPQWRCTALRARALGCDPQTELVVFQSGTKDTCDGDSGGALYLRQNGQNALVGITSRAVRNARVRCGKGGIYLHVTAIADWLTKRLHQDMTQARKEESP